jgi:hypothetical protein
MVILTFCRQKRSYLVNLEVIKVMSSKQMEQSE